MPGECLEVRSTARRQLEAFGKLSPRGQDSLTMNGICLVRSKPRVSSGQWVLTLTQCCKLASGSPHNTNQTISSCFSPIPFLSLPFSSPLPFFFLLASFISFFLFLAPGIPGLHVCQARAPPLSDSPCLPRSLSELSPSFPWGAPQRVAYCNSVWARSSSLLWRILALWPPYLRHTLLKNQLFASNPFWKLMLINEQFTLIKLNTRQGWMSTRRYACVTATLTRMALGSLFTSKELNADRKEQHGSGPGYRMLRTVEIKGCCNASGSIRRTVFFSKNKKKNDLLWSNFVTQKLVNYRLTNEMCLMGPCNSCAHCRPW